MPSLDWIGKKAVVKSPQAVAVSFVASEYRCLDDVEIARFRLMMEEILPPKNYTTTLIWKSRRNLDNRSLHNVSSDHEYVVAYRMGDNAFRGQEKDMDKYSNPDNDPRGPWMSDNLVGLATKDRRPNLHYDLINPETGAVYPCLHEYHDFSDLIRVVAGERRIDPYLVEKDYWLVHSLYGLQKAGYNFQLKGGTSLSKGYGIIHRFSEDIDIHIVLPEGGGKSGHRKIMTRRRIAKVAKIKKRRFPAIDLQHPLGENDALFMADEARRMLYKK